MTSLLPPNATPLERAVEASMARFADLPVPLRDLWNPDTCPIELLPYLAWALSIDAWSSDWPENVRRARVRHAVDIARHKGTAESVREVVQSFGGAVALREWWQMEPRGEPHTFQLAVTLNGEGGQPATAAFTDVVIAEVRRTKPVRSHFTYALGVNLGRDLGIFAAARPAIVTRLQLDAAAA